MDGYARIRENDRLRVPVESPAMRSPARNASPAFSTRQTDDSRFCCRPGFAEPHQAFLETYPLAPIRNRHGQSFHLPA